MLLHIINKPTPHNTTLVLHTAKKNLTKVTCTADFHNTNATTTVHLNKMGELASKLSDTLTLTELKFLTGTPNCPS